MTERRTRLVVFDLDGTLTDTVPVDESCYAESLAACFGWSPRVADYDWNEAEHVSDRGILDHLCRTRLGRSPTFDELEAFEGMFLSRLVQAADETPRCMAPIEGALALLERLAEADWRLAVATGGLREGAALKLERSGISRDLIHGIATGSDAAPRQEIVKHAVRRAGADPKDRYLLIGDGRWDLLTAQALDRPFVARASGARADLLRRLGTEHVVPDYSDPDAVVSLFESLIHPHSAPVPGVGRR